MLPTRDEAKALLRAGARTNPGLWTAHSACVAHCARVIAEAAGLDGEKAYILGLLHDIGKSERVCALYHVWLGWRQMNELGYGEAARICLTHSFQVQDLDSFMGQRDVTDAQYAQLERELAAVQYDEYDRLIQLCDAVGDVRPVVIEQRLVDVALRRGLAPRTVDKWRAVLELKKQFDKACGQDICRLLRVHP